MARKAGASKTKTFRKTDIAAVEQNLDDARTQKMVTGAVIADAPNATLFTLDTKGQTAKPGWSRQTKPLRLDEIVKPQSKIVAPAQKKAAKVDEKLVKRKIQAAMKLAKASLSAPAAPSKKSEEKILDPWADESTAVPMPKAKITRTPAVKAKAVRLPSAGASYNPDAAEHERLIEAATAQEVARQERLDKSKAALQVPLAPRPETANYDETTGMIFEDIFASEPEAAEEDAEDASAAATMLPSLEKRKSKAEKKRELALAEAERLRKEAKVATIVDNQALHSKTLLKRVRVEQAAIAQSKADRKRARAQRRGKLGPNRYVPAPLDVKLPEELTGSLRALKPEGNLLEDRFRALQEQAKIETRSRRVLRKRKYELKTYLKNGHKATDVI